MNVNTGMISSLATMKASSNDTVVPVPTEKVNPMRNWGSRKRVRYAELLKLGKSQEDAFDIVENHKGVIQ